MYIRISIIIIKFCIGYTRTSQKEIVRCKSVYEDNIIVVIHTATQYLMFYIKFWENSQEAVAALLITFRLKSFTNIFPAYTW